jgi:hypothetical protein
LGQIDLQEAIISAYRDIISDRYDYDLIKSKHPIPESISRDKFHNLREYFLGYVYPPIERRKELNEAFESLDGHIKHPEHLVRILLDSTSLLFKYGIHLPKILRAGIKALKSYRTASRLELRLTEEAAMMDVSAPYSKKVMASVIRQIPRNEIDQFMEDSLALFETLHDQQLVKSIISIVGSLIEKMKKHPKVYAQNEVKGLEIGRDIIVQGNELFTSLPASEQEQLFNLIYEIEKGEMDRIFQEI